MQLVVAELTSEQEEAVRILREGLAHHDAFGAVDDGSQIYACPSETLYEFPASGPNEALRLGHLRDILSIFPE